MSTAATATTKPHPLRVFISYSHRDDKLREKFVKGLSQLQRDGLIEGWDDRGIAPGTEWAGVIDDRLQSAEIVVLLVSNDFLASKYCNEIELETALQRHEAGLASVIPVILRPCDWESSRFGKLQALPREGKPVVDWKTEDHGFLNVVKGLRSLATDLRKDVVQAAPTRGVRAGLRRRWRVIAGIAALVTILAIGGYLGSKQQVAQGDYLLDHRKWKESEDAYQRAKLLNPYNAEAYFGLGVLFDLEKDPEAAAKMFEQAAKLSPLPQYESNLADEYFKLGQYKRAVDEYAGINQFPSAALESAKINRLRNEFDAAEEQNRRAIRWLNDNSIANLPENKLPWYFTTDTKSIWLKTREEKLCYAQFELSITVFLKGNDSGAKQYSDAATKTCDESLPDIVAELKPELERLANEQPELADRGKQYTLQFLTPHP